MLRLTRRLPAVLLLIVAIAFLGHGAALAGGMVGCETAEASVAGHGPGGAGHHGDPERSARHDACCAQACAIAMMPAPLFAPPVAIGTTPWTRIAALTAIDPFRIDRPPRTIAAA